MAENKDNKELTPEEKKREKERLDQEKEEQKEKDKKLKERAARKKKREQKAKKLAKQENKKIQKRINLPYKLMFWGISLFTLLCCVFLVFATDVEVINVIVYCVLIFSGLYLIIGSVLSVFVIMFAKDKKFELEETYHTEQRAIAEAEEKQKREEMEELTRIEREIEAKRLAETMRLKEISGSQNMHADTSTKELTESSEHSSSDPNMLMGAMESDEGLNKPVIPEISSDMEKHLDDQAHQNAMQFDMENNTTPDPMMGLDNDQVDADQPFISIDDIENLEIPEQSNRTDANE